MSTTEVDLEVGVEAAFAALVDATRYPEWLLGARRIRSVDPSWPEVGSCFRHVIGAGPLVVAGSTCVMACDPPKRLELLAGMGPLGSAHVRFAVSPSVAGCHVAMEERAATGPVRVVWRWVRPVVEAAIFGRNAFSLQRLKALIEAR